VPEGGVVVFGFQVMKLEAYKGKEDVMKAIMSVVHSRGLKAVCLSLGAIAPLIFEDIYERNNLEEIYGLTYGVDYVITPFISGEETAMASFAADTWSTMASDLFGTPIQNIPLMQEVRSAEDVDLWWFASYSAGNIDQAVRQWGWAYDQPIIMAFQSYGSAAYAYPWPLVGVLDGIRGEAEFEYMSGFPGAELARYEGQSTAGITMLSTIAIGLIYYNLTRKTVREEEFSL
jgi:hypothetical protein